MSVLTGRIFAGHLRSIIGSMTVEQIIRERQKLATEVLDGSKEEMARIGLTVDALQIQSIDDGELGYINAMSAPHNAAIQQAGADRSGAGEPGGRARRAGVTAQAGRIRPPDRHRQGAVQGRGRQGAGAGRPGRARWPRPRPSAKCWRRTELAQRPPNCASRSWSPRWSNPPRPRPSGSGSWRSPTRRRSRSRPRPRRRTTGWRWTGCSSTSSQIVEKAAPRGLCRRQPHGAQRRRRARPGRPTGWCRRARPSFDALRGGVIDYAEAMTMNRARRRSPRRMSPPRPSNEPADGAKTVDSQHDS